MLKPWFLCGCRMTILFCGLSGPSSDGGTSFRNGLWLLIGGAICRWYFRVLNIEDRSIPKRLDL